MYPFKKSFRLVISLLLSFTLTAAPVFASPVMAVSSIERTLPVISDTGAESSKVTAADAALPASSDSVSDSDSASDLDSDSDSGSASPVHSEERDSESSGSSADVSEDVSENISVNTADEASKSGTAGGLREIVTETSSSEGRVFSADLSRIERIEEAVVTDEASDGSEKDALKDEAASPESLKATLNGDSTLLSLPLGLAEGQLSVLGYGDPGTIYIPCGMTSVTIESLTLDVESAFKDVTFADSVELVLKQGDKAYARGFSEVNDSKLQSFDLFFFDRYTDGDYSLTLKNNNSEYGISNYTFKVVDAPVISYVTFNDDNYLYAGEDLTVSVSYLNLNTAPDAYTLSLVYMNDTEKTTAAVSQEKPLYLQNYGLNGVDVVYGMTFQDGESIVSGHEYTLEISRKGSETGNVYASIDTVTATAVKRPFTITDAYADEDPKNNEIHVSAAGLSESDTADYYAVVTMDNTILYRSDVSRNDTGLFDLPLTTQGIELPLTAYSGRKLTVVLTETVGETETSDSYYFWIPDYSESRALEATLSIAAPGTAEDGKTPYAFTLEGVNLFGDLYAELEEKKTAISSGTVQLSDIFCLYGYNDEKAYVQAAAAGNSLSWRKSENPTSKNCIYTFTGTLYAETPLKDATLYFLHHGSGTDDPLASCTYKRPDLAVEYCSLLYSDYSEYSAVTGTVPFWLNFGKLPVDAKLTGSSGTVTAQLVYKDDSVVYLAGQSSPVTGTASDGGMLFSFVIDVAPDLSSDKTYYIQFVDKVSDEELGLCRDKTNYTYRGGVIQPYWNLKDDIVYENATSLDFTAYYYERRELPRNLTKENLEIPTLYCPGHGTAESGKAITLTKAAEINYTLDDSLCWNLTLELLKTGDDTETKLHYGEYYFNRTTTYSYKQYFSVIPENTLSLGALSCIKTESGLSLSFENCKNLPDSGTWTASVYDVFDARLVGDNISLTKEGTSLKANITASAMNDFDSDTYYSMAVFLGGIFVGNDYFSVRTDEDESVTDPFVTAYYDLNEGDDEDPHYTEIDYVTPEKTIYFDVVHYGYSWVRFSDNFETLARQSFEPVRPYMAFELSEGNAVKTVYIQFSKTRTGAAGDLSNDLTYEVLLNEETKSESESVILDLDCDPKYIGESTDFTICLTASMQLSTVYGQFLYNDDEGTAGITEGTKTWPFVFEKTADEGSGSVFKLALNSGTLSLDRKSAGEYYTTSDIKGIRCYVQPKPETQTMYIQDLSLCFGSPETIILSDLSKYEHSPTYTNANSIVISGFGKAGKEITIKLCETSNSSLGNVLFTKKVTPSEKQTFTTEAFTLNNEGRYCFEAAYTNTDDGTEKTLAYLTVDRTAPVISDDRLSLSGGKVHLTWSCTDANFDYFLLSKYPNGGAAAESIWTAENDKDDLSYEADAPEDGTVYLLQAVDKAGNKSEKTFTVKDTEVPTVPGVPTLVTNGSKYVTFKWTASEDNVGVKEYRIYKGSDSESFATVPAGGSLSYTCTELPENATVTISVEALDAAGNRSEKASAALSTANISVSTTTQFAEEYITTETDSIPIDLKLACDESFCTNELKALFVYWPQSHTDQLKTIELASADADSSCRYRYTGNWSVKDLVNGNYVIVLYIQEKDGTITKAALNKSQVSLSDGTEEPTLYTVTVKNSYASASGAGTYAPGDTVTLNAGSRSSYSFSKWTSSDVTLTNPTSNTVTFVMPEKNVTVTANWSYNGGSSGGGGGGGGGGTGGIAKGYVFADSAAAATAAFTGVVAYSKNWITDADGQKKYRQGNGEILKNAWLCDDLAVSNGKDVWHLLSTDGSRIITGLLQDGTGNYYSMETDPESPGYGMLRFKNGTYNCNGTTIYLEFEQQHNGSFGAIRNAEGLEKLKKTYSVYSSSLNNSSIVYSGENSQ